MKPLLNGTASVVAGIVLSCLAVVEAGMGLLVFALLAMFALATAGLAIVASPFVAMAHSIQPAANEDHATAV